MRKALTILFLVITLFGQGVVAAKAVPDLDSVEHAASHGGGSHHHDDDGSTRYDSSDESLQHMQADHFGIVGGPAVEPPALHSPALRHSRLAVVSESPPPDPFLEGLHRPPRHAA